MLVEVEYAFIRSTKKKKGTLLSFFGLKRGPPSTGSSTEGTVSQVRKTAKLQESAEEVRIDLREEFDAAMDDKDPNNAPIIKEFEKQMEACFSEFKQQMRVELENVFVKLNSKVKELETKVKVIESKLVEKDVYEKEYQRTKIELNRQEQRSRIENLRFFGLKEQRGDEDSRKVVCGVIKDKMKVTISTADISIAHRLPKPPTQVQKPIIAKFKDRTQRQEILKQRRVLKGTGISVCEDMTRENVKLVQEAERSRCFEAVWFANGKVQAKDKGDNKFILELYDDFAEIVAKRGKRK